MKATMLGGPCHKCRQAERAVRSTGLVTASARGAARVTGDAPRSLEAVVHSPDNSVGARICATLLCTTTFSNVLVIEFAAMVIATISDLAGLPAKAIGGRAMQASTRPSSGWNLSQARPAQNVLRISRALERRQTHGGSLRRGTADLGALPRERPSGRNRRDTIRSGALNPR
jgi:hypothetical protein